MTAFESARLRRGDCVRFLDGEYGRVQSIRSELDLDEKDFGKLKLYRWVKIQWDDGSETEIEVEDLDEIDIISARDPEQEKLVSRRLLRDAIAESSL